MVFSFVMCGGFLWYYMYVSVCVCVLCVCVCFVRVLCVCVCVCLCVCALYVCCECMCVWRMVTYPGGGDDSLHDRHELSRENLSMQVGGTVLHDGVEHTQAVVHHLRITVQQLLTQLLHCILNPVLTIKHVRRSVHEKLYRH